MRSWLLAGAICTMAVGQAPCQPTRVIDTGAFDLGWRFGVLVTPDGRILTHADVGSPDFPARMGIWEGTTGIPVRLDLPPFEPEQEQASCLVNCGGDGFGTSGPHLEPNAPPLGWDPARRTFALRTEGRRICVNEHGDVLEGQGEALPTAKIDVHGFTTLQVTRVDGSTESLGYPMPEIPELEGMTGLQKYFARRLGFRNVLVGRTGDWVAATWMGGKRNAPNRAIPWVEKGPLRWLLFHVGTPEPLVDMPLFALTGSPSTKVTQSLSPAGTRILLEVPGRVVVVDPHAGEVILNRPGVLVHLTTGRDEVILAAPPEERSLARYALQDGRRVGTLILPATLDPTSETVGPEPAASDPAAPRGLTRPLAFSPDGRWVVTAQHRRGGSGWDALVLWEFQAP